MNAHVVPAHPDADLLALGNDLLNAWQAERAAFRASGDDFVADQAIISASDNCQAIASQIVMLTPKTLDGVRVLAMVWGHAYYLSESPGEYEGADSDYPCERAANAVMSFLLKDVA
ncbi:MULTISPECIES: hypothetical protein [unclassified Mesorhizobium]|uniref:hypothetical protein n=1 Tax=unclassified Mesorhizobium TaxID=325217 RepID=UPI000FCB0B9A|nr:MULTISPECIES: hypothetical protein [unclassified Mesorhizobium]RUW26341.1 hypothetical protein EOA34_08655 [Mesorhizobium sp. M4B.F.Ca.ET.013.02.1.1]RVD21170.1 hypothetical protein EN738_19750 [Mesorhizobium sp. M4B.F.Ca.ET.017.02.2.1]